MRKPKAKIQYTKVKTQKTKAKSRKLKCKRQKTIKERNLSEDKKKHKRQNIKDDLFDLILYVASTIFQLNRDGSSWVEPVLS